jgi:hypothetical protein
LLWQANEVNYFKFIGSDTLRAALEDTELVEFPTILVLSDDELSRSAFSVVDKQDARSLHRRSERGKGDHQPEAGGERPAEHALPVAKETTVTTPTTAQVAVTKPLPPIPAPASVVQEASDDDDAEEEGFAFATLVDY